MDYKEKYEMALEGIQEILSGAGESIKTSILRKRLQPFFSELRESEDDRIRKELIQFIKNWKDSNNIGRSHDFPTLTRNIEQCDRYIAWLEEQKMSEEAMQYLRENHSPSEISDFQAAMNIAVAKAYDKGMKDGLEKQGQEPKKVSIWKHWKDGIAGNGEGEQIYLMKYGNTYHLSSCLSFECDYIELSELDNLMLDKQEEQKKFHEGEWLCENEPNNYARFIQILEIVNVQGEERYRISRDIHNDEDIVEFDFVEKYYHKFDIKDAKDGDVLISQYGKPFIYNGNCDSFHIGSYCGISVEDRFNVATEKCHWTENVNIHPATKEQRDALMKAMADAGYTFDFKKKELKKIEDEEHNGEDDGIDSLRHTKNIFEKTLYKSEEQSLSFQIQAYLNTASDELYAKGKPLYSEERLEEIHKCMLMWQTLHNAYFYRKPAWSEKDESHCQMLQKIICDSSASASLANKLSDWLNSLKDRVQPQPNQEWSEEDEKNWQGIWDEIWANKYDAKEYEWDTYDRFLNWLKSIKQRVGG